ANRERSVCPDSVVLVSGWLVLLFHAQQFCGFRTEGGKFFTPAGREIASALLNPLYGTVVTVARPVSITAAGMAHGQEEEIERGGLGIALAQATFERFHCLGRSAGAVREH